MPKMNLSNADVELMTLAARAVKNPKIFVESSSHLIVVGLWKRHLPYRISFDIIANSFGGVEVKAAILPFYGLYSRSIRDTLSTHLDLNGGDAGYLLTISDAMKYLVKLLGANRAFSHTPPKDLSRDELFEWTVTKSGATRAVVTQFFEDWKL